MEEGVIQLREKRKNGTAILVTFDDQTGHSMEDP